MSYNRYSRQTVLSEIGIEGQKRFEQSRVAVIGCGALGTYIASFLVRAGVGEVVIVDRDVVELNNLQRQALFNEGDVGLPKVTAASEKLKSINSSVKIEPVLKDLNSGNIETILKRVDLIMDGTDNFRTRYLLNDYSLKHGIPWIYSGVIGTEGIVTFFNGNGPCLRCISEDIPAPGETPTCESAGIVNTLPPIITGLAVTKGFKYLITGKGESELYCIDPWKGLHNSVDIEKNEDCPCCGKKDYEFLDTKKTDMVLSLCEKGVQIIPGERVNIDLKSIARRIRWDKNQISVNDYMLRGIFEGVTVSVFADGRAIIKGIGNEGAAESFYSRIIGI